MENKQLTDFFSAVKILAEKNGINSLVIIADLPPEETKHNVGFNVYPDNQQKEKVSLIMRYVHDRALIALEEFQKYNNTTFQKVNN